MKDDLTLEAEPFDLEAAFGASTGFSSDLEEEETYEFPGLGEDEEFLDSELSSPDAATGFVPTPVETPGGGRIQNKTPPAPSDLVTVTGVGGGSIQLHRLAADAWRAMVAAARAAGLASPLLLPTSGYRSPVRQQRLWQEALRKYGTPQAARRWVAPPGSSAHQTGRAIDFHLGGRNNSANVNALRMLPAYQWLAANANRFGFYPYSNEPWHWEYNPPSSAAPIGTQMETGAATLAARPAGTIVRQFTCGDADRAAIERALQMSIPTASLKSAVEQAARNAVSWLGQATPLLQVSPRTEQNKRIFRGTFGTTPEFVPAWRPKNATWVDRGDLVAIRLRRAAGILGGGWIKYYCWGSPRYCPECTRQPPTYYACSSWGKAYVICLGEAFWKDWQARRYTSMASTLIHEALHIYFGRLVSHGERGRYGDANCYVRLVLELNGISLPDRIVRRCAKAP